MSNKRDEAQAPAGALIALEQITKVYIMGEEELRALVEAMYADPEERKAATRALRVALDAEPATLDPFATLDAASVAGRRTVYGCASGTTAMTSGAFCGPTTKKVASRCALSSATP